MGWASSGGWESWTGQSCCLWEGLAATTAVSGGSPWPHWLKSGSFRHGWLNKSTGSHGSSAALVDDTHSLGDHGASQPGGTPTIPAAFLPGTQRIAGMGYKGRMLFFFFYLRNVEMQISTISLFMCLSPQSLHFSWGIERSLLPRSAIPWQGTGSHVQSPSGWSLNGTS